MSESAAVGAQKGSKKKAACKPHKKLVDHPKYSEMIKAAVMALKDRAGSSRQAILKYIAKHYNVGADEKIINQHLKMSLRAGVKSGSLKQAKGSGASGSFRLGDSVKKAPAKAKKVESAKKAAGEKRAKVAKKAKSPKKAKAVKPKKAATSKTMKAAGKSKKAAGRPKKPVGKPKKATGKAKKSITKK
ncbi:hypothetical protein LSH36_377g02042 [Paralvinella palmiformis]|uniref:H15 domain-containing protein n=1 Tax=Paralvinella palmiformis TaxID=53620 RepID=A0AAD9JES8_9ANNE|nr:hypothetical protein LSH36_377g02042 [Paralvinella palmiformis]